MRTLALICLLCVAGVARTQDFKFSGEFVSTIEKLPKASRKLPWLPLPLDAKSFAAVKIGKGESPLSYLLVFKDQEALDKAARLLKEGQNVKVNGEMVFPIIGAGRHPEFRVKTIEVSK